MRALRIIVQHSHLTNYRRT